MNEDGRIFSKSAPLSKSILSQSNHRSGFLFIVSVSHHEQKAIIHKHIFIVNDLVKFGKFTKQQNQHKKTQLSLGFCHVHQAKNTHH